MWPAWWSGWRPARERRQVNGALQPLTQHTGPTAAQPDWSGRWPVSPCRLPRQQALGRGRVRGTPGSRQPLPRPGGAGTRGHSPSAPPWSLPACPQRPKTLRQSRGGPAALCSGQRPSPKTPPRLAPRSAPHLELPPCVELLQAVHRLLPVHHGGHRGALLWEGGTSPRAPTEHPTTWPGPTLATRTPAVCTSQPLLLTPFNTRLIGPPQACLSLTQQCS